MCEERAKIRCAACELVQWADHANCRRCGQVLPAPIVNVVERVVEKIIVQQDSQCLDDLQKASKLISAIVARLQEPCTAQTLPAVRSAFPSVKPFPTLDEMERALIVAAYRRSNRKPLEAARLLGIGKTTLYRKLKELRQAA